MLLFLFLCCAPAFLSAFRVMTYNVWNFNDGANWDERKFEVATFVNASNPDVIAFQELRYGCNESQISDLEALLPQYSHSYVPVMVYTSEPCIPTTEGQAIFSKIAPLGFNHEILPLSVSSSDTNKRAVLHAVFSVDSVVVDVYAAHLSTSSTEQLINAQDVLQYINTTITSPYVILMGDFNSYHDNTLLPTLTESTEKFSLSDAWSTFSGTNTIDEASCTYRCDTPTRPYQQRDHILFNVGYFELASTSIVGNMTASDHRAVVADLNITTPPSTPPSMNTTTPQLASTDFTTTPVLSTTISDLSVTTTRPDTNISETTATITNSPTTSNNNQSETTHAFDTTETTPALTSNDTTISHDASTISQSTPLETPIPSQTTIAPSIENTTHTTLDNNATIADTTATTADTTATTIADTTHTTLDDNSTTQTTLDNNATIDTTATTIADTTTPAPGAVTGHPSVSSASPQSTQYPATTLTTNSAAATVLSTSGITATTATATTTGLIHTTTHTTPKSNTTNTTLPGDSNAAANDPSSNTTGAYVVVLALVVFVLVAMLVVSLWHRRASRSSHRRFESIPMRDMERDDDNELLL